jgi:hypothetical protein
MARQLKLVKRLDLAAVAADADVLDILLWLSDKGWIQSSDGNEVITLHIPGEDDDDLAANVQLLDAKLREIEWAKDKLEPYGVWLRAQLTGETGARQAYALDGKRSPGHAVSGLFIKESFLESYQLGLTRVPLWENTDEVDIPIEAAISANGGMLNYVGLNGDAAARIASLVMGSDAGTFVTEFWIGAKDDRGGTINPFNFVPVWNLHNGTLWGDDDVSVEVDATALDGYKVRAGWAWGDLTLLPKVTIQLSQAVSFHLADQRGRYRALLRARVTDPSLISRVRLGQAFVSNDLATFAYNSRQLIGPGSGWFYYDMGQVSIPPLRSPSGTTWDNAGFRIDAEKVSGTGDLELDSLILIPMDHSLHAVCDNFGVDSVTILNLVSWPDGDLTGLITDFEGMSVQAVIPNQNNWALPQGNGAIVCAAQYADESDLDLTIWPTLRVYERWQTLRGSGQSSITVLNPSFEIAGAGEEPFAGWTAYVEGVGNLVERAAYSHTGTYSAAVTIAVAGTAEVLQDFYVVASRWIALRFWGYSGYYSVYDLTHDEDIVAETLFNFSPSEDPWHEVTEIFQVPEGCLSIEVLLYDYDTVARETPGPLHFDDVSLEYVPEP